MSFWKRNFFALSIIKAKFIASLEWFSIDMVMSFLAVYPSVNGIPVELVILICIYRLGVSEGAASDSKYRLVI